MAWPFFFQISKHLLHTRWRIFFFNKIVLTSHPLLGQRCYYMYAGFLATVQADGQGCHGSNEIQCCKISVDWRLIERWIISSFLLCWYLQYDTFVPYCSNFACIKLTRKFGKIERFKTESDTTLTNYMWCKSKISAKRKLSI